MKTQSKYSLADLYKIKQIKREIEDLRKQLLEIDREIGGIKQYINDVEPNQLTNYSQEFSDRNDDSKTESAEEDKEKLWGNYILVILLAFYLVVMSFL
jgi:predicted  nucleic acid-binding Zn-ribbon protein